MIFPKLASLVVALTEFLSKNLSTGLQSFPKTGSLIEIPPSLKANSTNPFFHERNHFVGRRQRIFYRIVPQA
jgi:hypothetical protein